MSFFSPVKRHLPGCNTPQSSRSLSTVVHSPVWQQTASRRFSGRFKKKWPGTMNWCSTSLCRDTFTSKKTSAVTADIPMETSQFFLPRNQVEPANIGELPCHHSDPTPLPLAKVRGALAAGYGQQGSKWKTFNNSTSNMFNKYRNTHQMEHQSIFLRSLGPHLTKFSDQDSGAERWWLSCLSDEAWDACQAAGHGEMKGLVTVPYLRRMHTLQKFNKHSPWKVTGSQYERIVFQPSFSGASC